MLPDKPVNPIKSIKNWAVSVIGSTAFSFLIVAFGAYKKRNLNFGDGIEIVPLFAIVLLLVWQAWKFFIYRAELKKWHLGRSE